MFYNMNEMEMDDVSERVLRLLRGKENNLNISDIHRCNSGHQEANTKCPEENKDKEVEELSSRISKCVSNIQRRKPKMTESGITCNLVKKENETTLEPTSPPSEGNETLNTQEKNDIEFEFCERNPEIIKVSSYIIGLVGGLGIIYLIFWWIRLSFNTTSSTTSNDIREEFINIRLFKYWCYLGFLRVQIWLNNIFEILGNALTLPRTAVTVQNFYL